jgi:hypothetical protein
MSKSNPVKGKRSTAKPRKVREIPVESVRIRTNREAVEDVIEWLYAKDALGKVDSATVAMARTIAARLDDPDDAKNARLWKEYRETVALLVKAGEERRNEFDDVLRDLEASLRNTSTK